MTPSEYIISIISKYAQTFDRNSYAYRLANEYFYPLIKGWAKDDLYSVSLSGSYAKGTGIKGRSDIDLFISLRHSDTLKNTYFDLMQYLRQYNLYPTKQNVSIGVDIDETHVDLIPGLRQSPNTNYHSIYRSRTNTWTQTNITEHINIIKNSGRLNEIKAIKIWSKLNVIYFPSFYLELTVIEALKGQSKEDLPKNIFTIFYFLSTEIHRTSIEDPSNTNNIISEDITHREKEVIATAAKKSLSCKFWEDILW